MCKETNETLSNMLNMRPILANNNYLKRQQFSRKSSQEYKSALWDQDM